MTVPRGQALRHPALAMAFGLIVTALLAVTGTVWPRAIIGGLTAAGLIALWQWLRRHWLRL